MRRNRRFRRFHIRPFSAHRSTAHAFVNDIKLYARCSDFHDAVDPFVSSPELLCRSTNAHLRRLLQPCRVHTRDCAVKLATSLNAPGFRAVIYKSELFTAPFLYVWGVNHHWLEFTMGISDVQWLRRCRELLALLTSLSSGYWREEGFVRTVLRKRKLDCRTLWTDSAWLTFCHLD